MAVHFGVISWPSSWISKKVGKSKSILVARANHPLPKRPSVKQIVEYPFVAPAYWTTEGLKRGNDEFPIPFSKRKVGFETATADAAVPILLNSDHIAFLPELLVQPFEKQNKLRQLRTPELSVVERDIYLSIKTDVITEQFFKQLCESMAEQLK
jgi:DNA-binding transcriptional LysR family regulator